MRIIEIEALPNGAHSNQSIIHMLEEIPEGWAVIPEDMELPDTFPFVNIVVDEENQIVTSMTAGVKPPADITLLKLQKEREISQTCHSTITSGCDVTLSDGEVYHFSLEETDQINLTTAFNAIQNGATGYPYHADGQLCRMYSAEDITIISDAVIEYKLYHLTYCNHLLTWIRRSETADELEAITYGAELPEDLAANMQEVLTTSASL